MLQPDLAKKAEAANRSLNAAIQKGLKSRFGPVLINVKRLLVTSDATGLPLDHDLSVVKDTSSLLYEEARRYYQWTGTLVDASLGSIFMEADPGRDFIFHVARRRVVNSHSIHMTISKFDQR